MRKLASIRVISDIIPIPNADAIECAVVGGWKVVVKKGEFQVGDLALYCEIDSWIPHELAPFLSKGKEPRKYNGVLGERLRTARLRGQISQGLLLPTTVIPSFVEIMADLELVLGRQEAEEEVQKLDFSELLNIQKWEAPIPAQLQGQVRGNFPTFIPKTDQERCQNLAKHIAEWCELGYEFELTEKLDGSSMTVFVFNEDEGVCSRNMNLCESEGNSFWAVCRREKLLDKIRESGMNIAIQGELIGEGIQKNPYNLLDRDFFLYDIYDIDNGRYFSPDERHKFCDRYGIKHVPIIVHGKDLGTGTVDELLEWAEDKSKLNPKAEREGIVFKGTNNDIHFKAISNKFLLGER